MESNTQSILERLAMPLAPRTLLHRLPGCAPYVNGLYEKVLVEVEQKLNWAGPRRLAQTATMYADPKVREAVLREAIWTEHYGGKFIEDFLSHYPCEDEKLMRRHASDELRHGDAFADFFNHPAPEGMTAPEGESSRQMYAALLAWTGGDYTSFIAVLHVLELRTAVTFTHWFYLLDMYPDEGRQSIHPLLARIARDEVFHLTYTLQILDRKLADEREAEILREAFLLSEKTAAEIQEASAHRSRPIATARVGTQ